MPAPTGSSQVTALSSFNAPRDVLALIGGAKWGGGLGTGVTLTYSFPYLTSSTAYFVSDYGSVLRNGPHGFDTSEVNFVKTALGIYSMYANIRFERVADGRTNVGDLRFAKADLSGNEAGRAYLPDGSPQGGDVWIDGSYSGAADFTPGRGGYFTLLHEIGHALGLKHPFQGTVRLPFETDTQDFSIMSYTDGSSVTHSAALSPMLFDVAALQKLYGANMRFRNGNDTYDETTITSMFSGYSGRAVLWDAGGIDTFVSRAYFIDLVEGGTPGSMYNGHQTTLSTLFGNIGVVIARGAVIENVQALTVGSQIYGNNADNVLRGALTTIYYNYPQAQIWGAGGDDTIFGDRAVAQDPNLTALSSNAWLYGGNGNDAIFGFRYRDMMRGDAGHDLMFGGDGDDGMIGGVGNDFFDGGAGKDEVATSLFSDEIITRSDMEIIQALDGAYHVRDLRAGSPYGTDIYYDIEQITFRNPGSYDTWTFYTSFTANADNQTIIDNGSGVGKVIFGLAGNDTITQTGTGNTRLDGGAGVDTLTGGTGNNVYVIDSAGDVINEAADAGIDTIWSTISVTLLPNIENIVLRGEADINAVGDDLSNILRGNLGVNELSGLGGADDIAGGFGNDRLTGGAGADRFIFDMRATGLVNVDRITDFSSDDTINLSSTCFTGLGPDGRLAASRFRAGDRALDADDRVLYDRASGSLFYDENGNRSGGRVLIAVIENNAALSAGDVFVI